MVAIQIMRFAASLFSVTAAFLLLSCPAAALPELSSPRDVEGLRIYTDDRRPRVFYYAPGKLAISQDVENTPDISFLQMRYMGTTATGHKGEFHTRSLLSFRVRMTGVTGNVLSTVREKLRSEGVSDPQIRPLPIRKIETVLNYTPLVDSEEADGKSETGKSIGSGALEEPEKPKPAEGYWTERVFTISPDDLTSQALWEAFHTGKVMLSLSYIFYSDGVMSVGEEPKLEGNDAAEQPDTPQAADQKQEPDPHTVLVDTIEVLVDAAKYPDRFKKVEINESIPPAYAALSVYCFDFNNSLRPDLSMKIVEVQAKSVTGRPITVRTRFTGSSPDIFSAAVKFPFAVLIRTPYRYRIREITTDGVEKAKPWQEGKSWSEILDVTTPPEEQPKPPPVTEEPDSGETP